MPVRRGHLAPQNTFIDTVIKKFDGFPGRNFVIGNALAEGCPIIYCNTSFCELTQYERYELVQKSCACDFLYGPDTDGNAITQIENALSEGEEKHIETFYYRKDGERFLCSIIVAPIKNEQGTVIMYIVNHEEIFPLSISDEENAKGVLPQRKISTIFRSSFKRKRSLKNIYNNNSRNNSFNGTAIKEHSEEEVNLIDQSSKLSVNNNSKPTSPIQPVNGNVWNEQHMRYNNFDKIGSSDTSLNVNYRNKNTPHRKLSHGLSEQREKTKLKCAKKSFSCDVELRRFNEKNELEDSDEFEENLLTRNMDKDELRSFENSIDIKSVSSPRSLRRVCSSSLSDLRSNNGSTSLLTKDNLKPLSSSEGDLLKASEVEHTDSLYNANESFRSKMGLGVSNTRSLTLSTGGTTHKVAQVMSLGSDVLPEYTVESPKIHPWTILHYSPFKAIWDWIVLFLVMYTAIVTPYMAAFVLTRETNKTARISATSINIEDDPLVIVDYIVDVMFIIDIFINFRTTFVDSNDEVVSDPRRVAVNYMKGWFIVDLLAAIPFELLIMIGNTDQTTTLIGLLKTARLLRLVRVARKLDRYSEYGMALLMLLMFGFALVAHWLACVWYAIGNFEEHDTLGWLVLLGQDTNMPYNKSVADSGPDLQTKYLTALYFTLSSLTGVGFGNVSANTNSEKVFTILIMFLGALMHAVIFGNVTAIIQRLYSGMAQYHATMRKVREFIRFYQIPSPLRQRLEDYAQYDYSYTNGIDMNEVLRNFPEGLQADICLHLNRQLLSSSPAFRNCTPGCLRSLSLKLATTHCPPGDYIIHNGDEITTLYWIGRGTVEIIQNDTIIAILGKNDSFGENFGLTSKRVTGKARASVRALTYCDLHSISRNDLLYILRAYPEFRKQFNDEMQITYDLRDPDVNDCDLYNSTFSINQHHSGIYPRISKSVEENDELPPKRPLPCVSETLIPNHENLNPPKSPGQRKFSFPSRRTRSLMRHSTTTNHISDRDYGSYLRSNNSLSSIQCTCKSQIKSDLDEIRNHINKLETTMNENMSLIINLLQRKKETRESVLIHNNGNDSVESDHLLQDSQL